jgi:hypothetical protein
LGYHCGVIIHNKMKKENKSTNDMQDAFPVIRIGYDMRLLDSNLTALPLLSEWKVRKGSKIPDNVLNANPEITQSLQDTNPSGCKVAFRGLNIWFDMVPFPEAGYIGLYGYHVETMVPEVVQQKLRMAG